MMTPLMIAASITSGACAGYLAPSVARWMTGRGDRIDLLACPACFSMLVVLLFNVRWFLWPDAMAVMDDSEMAAWSGLRVLSIIASASLLWAFVKVRRV